MHIPDGYLSPETCAAMYAASVPFWYKASRSVKKVLSSKTVPMLAVLSAFSFTVQMLNVPLPGGTSAHAVGGTLMAIVLGPWAAIIGLSVALSIQALFFGDGGIISLGANIFNMGIALPLVGYAIYRLLSAGGECGRRRRIIAAAVGSYIGINVAGLLVAIELGIQPLIWSEGGRALYSPYGLSVTIPAVVLPHLTIVGFVEAALTSLAVSYLLRVHPALMGKPSGQIAASRRPLWLAVAGLVVLILATPLGLIATGTAFGEWGPEQFNSLVGYVPRGLAHLGGAWSGSVLPGYQLPGGGGTGIVESVMGYLVSALTGVGLISGAVILFYLATRLIGKRKRRGAGTRGGTGTSGGFLGKTIAGVSGALERTIFTEEQARLPGFLQQVDPRVKLAGIVLLLIVVGLSRGMALIGVVYGVSLALAHFSKLPPVSFVRRTWLGIPLLAAVVALPALFVVPGPALLGPIHVGSLTVAVTEPGFRSATLLVARVGTSVSLGMLLVMTTRWSDLLKALRILRVPQVFVVVLGMTYRYLFMLLRLVGNLFMARASRTVGETPGGEQRRWLASSAGALLSRSLKTSEDVHMAMRARGYAGEVRSLDGFRMVQRDWLLLSLVTLFAMAALILDRGLL